MARIRTIKPEFFINEELAELPPIVRLLYIGLWTQADRAGRMEYRPKRLKIALLPYDNGDIEVMLAKLESAGFITRYVVSDQQFLAINNFEKHQSPHHKEAVSSYPAPDEDGASTVLAPVEPLGREGKGKERKDTSSSKPDDALFDAFWSNYPKRVSKQAAVKAWQKLTIPQREKAASVVASYPFDRRDSLQYVPHPATWLNQGRYDDELSTAPKPKPCLVCSGSAPDDCEGCLGTGRQLTPSEFREVYRERNQS